MGDYFVDHFAGTREHELEVFRRAVTDWEGGFSCFSLSSLFPLPPLLLLFVFCILASPLLGHLRRPSHTVRVQSRLFLFRSEHGPNTDELTISPTIHRIDLGTASCILSVKSSIQGDGVKGMEVFLKFRFLGISKGC